MAKPRADLIHVFADADALAGGTVAWLVRHVFAQPHALTICLAGGSTPRRLYQVLASDHHKAIKWPLIHWFFSDERFVPHDHADSNFRMAHETLFAAPGAAETHVHPVPIANETPASAASAYENTLRSHYRAAEIDQANPIFSATLLGIGEDGHIASLFPGAAALNERLRWALAVEGVKPEPRITLAYPVLEASRCLIFLVSGPGKRDIVGRIWRGDDLPATRLKPSGDVHWFIDRAADPR